MSSIRAGLTKKPRSLCFGRLGLPARGGAAPTPAGHVRNDRSDRGLASAATARLQRGPGPCRRNGILGPRCRRDGPGGRRSLLQHIDHRLSGNPDRSVLRGADHNLYVSAYRQCRRQLRGPRGDDPGGARPRDPQHADRAGQLPRRAVARFLAQIAPHHRAVRRRYAAPDAPDSRQGAAERGHRLQPGRNARSRRDARRGTRVAGPRRHGPGARGHLPAEL